MKLTPPSPGPVTSGGLTDREHFILMLMERLIVLAVVIAIFILAVRHDLDKASVTALYGTVFGIHTASIAGRMRSRLQGPDK